MTDAPAQDQRNPKPMVLLAALQKIARGRPDNGRPLGGERARQIAREALVERGDDW